LKTPRKRFSPEVQFPNKILKTPLKTWTTQVSLVLDLSELLSNKSQLFHNAS